MRIKALIPPALAAIVVGVIAVALSSHRSKVSATHSTVALSGKPLKVPITNFAFVPQVVTVRAGTRIIWTNHDATAHSATADKGAFDTGTLNQGQSKAIMFDHPGTYTYHCIYHAFMTATIKVVK